MKRKPVPFGIDFMQANDNQRVRISLRLAQELIYYGEAYNDPNQAENKITNWLGYECTKIQLAELREVVQASTKTNQV